MPLYSATITFTGNPSPRSEKRGFKLRPDRKSVVIKATTFDKAAKVVYKYAQKYWPDYRFELQQLNSSKVLE